MTDSAHYLTDEQILQIVMDSYMSSQPPYHHNGVMDSNRAMANAAADNAYQVGYQEAVTDLRSNMKAAVVECRAEAKEAAAGLVEFLERMAPEVPFCVGCRFFGPMDEDGCCTTCGADVIILPVAAVTADWDKFLEAT